jgi:hypothetical protein
MAKSTALQPDIRWSAVWMTAVVWVIGTVMITRLQGQTVARAAALAGLSALGGLVAWMIYHAISRRNDGLAIIMTALLGTVASSQRAIGPLKEEIAECAVRIVIFISMAVVFGAFLRNRPKRREQPIDSPLWDADFDRPIPR